jgi:hypothetical protein
MFTPSRPKTADQVKGDVASVLQHLDDAAKKLNDRLVECDRQISWVKAHETWDEEVESLQIISDLEIRAEVLSDKVSEAQSLQASIREFFNMH